jgi:hypothetical protein
MYSKDDLLEEIVRLAEDGEPPSLTDINERSQYSSSPYYNHFGSWESALQKAGFEPPEPGDNTPPNKIPRDALLNELEDLADGETAPSAKEMAQSGAYSVTAYQNEFGSWKEALEVAGYSPRRTYSEDKLIEEIHRLAEDSEPPSANTDLAERGRISLRTYINHFGSWNRALREAGYEPPTPFTRQELLDEVHRLADDRTPPTKNQMNSSGKASSTTYRRYFGTWNNSLREAGYEPSRETDIAKDKLIGEIRRLGSKDIPPTLRDVGEGKYSESVYLQKFGSWRAAVREAGYEDSITNLDTKEILVGEIDRLSDDNIPPTQREMTQNGKFGVSRYQQKWETWNEALEAAGYEPNAEQNIPKDTLIDSLQSMADQLGRPPRVHELNEHGQYSVPPYEEKFGSWWAALLEANLRPQRMYPLTPEAFQKLYESTTSYYYPKPERTLLTLLFQFTGLSARGAISLSSNHVIDLNGDVGIRLPTELTAHDTPWEFIVPETWYDPVQDTERPTYLPDLLLWYFSEYDTLTNITTRTSTYNALYDEALKAGLLEHRNEVQNDGETVPQVRPVDLRFTHGVHLYMNGAPNEILHRRLGLDYHGSYITVEKIEKWVEQNQHLYPS